jgi:hypothetical protein
MAMNFNELSGLKQWGAVIAGGAYCDGGAVLHGVQEPER